MTQPLNDETIWGVPTEEMPDPLAPVADDDFCTIKGTHCQFWHSVDGCLMDDEGCVVER